MAAGHAFFFILTTQLNLIPSRTQCDRMILQRAKTYIAQSTINEFKSLKLGRKLPIVG